MKILRDVYAEKAIAQVPRILSLEDRNEFSSTFGCFERTYWLDKALDFPNALPQFGVHVLALIYSHKFPGGEIYFRNNKIKKWCIAGMDFWTNIQHNDGSFDEFYPNERGWAGPTGFTLYAVLSSYNLLKDEIPTAVSDRILEASYKAAKYLGKYDEHGILANHHAMALMPIYLTYKTLNDESLLKLFYDKLEYFMTLVSPEGWSLEYDGPDIGYLSATVSFLGKLHTMYKEEHRDSRVYEVIKNAIEFTSYFAYPNKYYAGTIGSRQTLHFYPHGYEIFGREIPLAGAIAEKMLEGLNEGKLVPPEIMPDRYLFYRVPEFLLSYLDWKPRVDNAPTLPYESKPFNKYFDISKIYITKKQDYYSVANLQKGGVTKIFGIDSSRLIYNDCGIIGNIDGKIVSSQWMDETYNVKINDDEMEVSGSLHNFSLQKPTPIKMLLLRSALIGLGWNTQIAYWLKGLIRKMIILGSKKYPVGFTRRIKFSNEKINMEDKIKILGKGNFDSLMVGDEFSVRYVPQSLFFQKQELDIEGFHFDSNMLKKLNDNREITFKRTIYPKREIIKKSVL